MIATLTISSDSTLLPGKVVPLVIPDRYLPGGFIGMLVSEALVGKEVAVTVTAQGAEGDKIEIVAAFADDVPFMPKSGDVLDLSESVPSFVASDFAALFPNGISVKGTLDIGTPAPAPSTPAS